MSDFAGHFLSEFFGLNKKVDDIVNNLVDDETPLFYQEHQSCIFSPSF